MNHGIVVKCEPLRSVVHRSQLVAAINPPYSFLILLQCKSVYSRTPMRKRKEAWKEAPLATPLSLGAFHSDGFLDRLLGSCSSLLLGS
jgi:hypothetical protein